jgi:hypothetical protein
VLAVGGMPVKVDSNEGCLKVACVVDIVEAVAACARCRELVEVQWDIRVRVYLVGLNNHGGVDDVWYSRGNDCWGW